MPCHFVSLSREKQKVTTRGKSFRMLCRAREQFIGSRASEKKRKNATGAPHTRDSPGFVRTLINRSRVVSIIGSGASSFYQNRDGGGVCVYGEEDARGCALIECASRDSRAFSHTRQGRITLPTVSIIVTEPVFGDCSVGRTMY